MPAPATRTPLSLVLAFALAAAALGAPLAQAQDAASKHLAPGFSKRSAEARLVLLPADIELFSVSAGGVIEPKADWTDAAQKNFALALAGARQVLGDHVSALPAGQADDFADIVTLHRAVAEAISLHHDGGRLMKLATKEDRLDWSLGDAVRPLKERTGADYALFTWIRDSYASPERKAMMMGMALIGGILIGGEQVGYASLVDLNTGRVVWFNELNRMSGDLRDERAAKETVEALLKDFPGMQ